jgi:hypothetical protein
MLHIINSSQGNVFVSATREACIGDHGRAVLAESSRPQTSTDGGVGTRWTPPEYINPGSKFVKTRPGDVFQFGRVVYAVSRFVQRSRIISHSA